MRSVVFDTVIFVRALINPRGLWGRLVFDHHADYHLILSPLDLREILEVLRRPEISRKYRLVQDLDIARVLEILGEADVVEVSGIPAVSRDTTDDKILATARAAQADYLVSEDQDLLVLGMHGTTRIVTARGFLTILAQPA